MKRFFNTKRLLFTVLLMAFMLVAFCSAAVTAQETEPVNHIVNGSFEMGSGGQWGAIPGWEMNRTVGTMDIYVGNYYYNDRDSFPSDTYIALRKEANPGGDAVSVTQTITDLPIGIYEFSAWVWSANNIDSFTITLTSSADQAEIPCFQGIKGYEYTEIAVKDGTLTITITADNVHKDAAMDALADDLSLIQIRGEEAFITPVPTEVPTPTPAPTATPAPSTPAKDTDAPPSEKDSILLPVISAVAAVALIAVVVLIILLVKKNKRSN